MVDETRSQTLEATLVRAANAARAVVRGKLFVSLRAEDGRPENQDALELMNDVQLRLLRKLQSPQNKVEGGDSVIRDVDSYARQAARNACAGYLRARYPLRTLLKNRLRRFFRSRQGYTEWDANGELVCGFAGWRNRPEYAPDAARVNTALANPASIAPEAQPRAGFEQLHADDWEILLDAVLRDLGCAVELDDLVSILAPRVGVKDALLETGKPAIDEVDPIDAADLRDGLQKSAGPEAEIFLRQLLHALWQGLLRMDPRRRAAFLLNPPSMEIELFPIYGVASIADIGRALALSDAQFATIFDGVLPAGTERGLGRASDEAKLAIIWNHLPLQDLLIGRVLGLSQQQVINQRMLARRTLSQELAPFIARGKK
jgi:hypothetical protein